MNGTERFDRQSGKVARFIVRTESGRAQFKDHAATYNVRKANRMNRKGRV